MERDAQPTQTPLIPPKTMSVPEAARELGISTSAAWRHISTGRIPSLRLGGRVLVSRARLAALIDGDEPIAAESSPNTKGAAASRTKDIAAAH